MKRLTIMATTALLAACGLQQAPDLSQNSENWNDVEEIVSSHITPFVNPEDPDANVYRKVAVGVLTPDGMKTYGFVAEGAGEAPTATSIYEIGSISKVFTGVALASMVNDGVISLDDALQSRLPDAVIPRFEDQDILIRHLSAHSSGLPRMPDNFNPVNPLDPYIDYTESDLYEYLKTHALRRAPGSETEYSNLAVGLLGHTLQIVDGQSTWEAVVRERICSRLHLDDTRQTVPEESMDRFLNGHLNGNQTPHWNFAVLAGAGALRSTVADLLEFAAANINPDTTPIGPTLEMAQTPVSGEMPAEGEKTMGLGWGITNIDGQTVLSHSGGTYGFSSNIVINRQAGTAVVVLGNGLWIEDDELDMAFFETGMKVLFSLTQR